MTRAVFLQNSIVVIAMTLLPLSAHALTLAELRDMTVLTLYGAIGFFGAAAIAIFCGGFGIYLARLGTEHRVEGIQIMIWAVETLFWVVVGTLILMWLE